MSSKIEPLRTYFDTFKTYITDKIEQRCEQFIQLFEEVENTNRRGRTSNDNRRGRTSVELAPPYDPRGIIERVQAFQQLLTEEITSEIDARARALYSISGGTSNILEPHHPERVLTDQFRLTIDDLGDHLISNLERFVNSGRSSPTISVDLFKSYDWHLLANAIQNHPGASSFAVQHMEFQSPGVSKLMLDTSRVLKRPDLAGVVAAPTDVESCLEELLHNCRPGPIPYYVGPLPPSKLDTLFPSGDLALQLNADDHAPVPGVTTLYAHLGKKGSGTPFHCEDGNAWSYNLNVYGYKLWLKISERSTDAFESFVKNLADCDRGCDQFVRHQSLFITPARLREEKIEFDLVCAGPGEMVITGPRQYHAVINLTTSFAIATNFILPGEEAISPSTRVCRDDGLFHLRNSRITRMTTATLRPPNKRPSPDPREPPAKRLAGCRTDTSETEASESAEDQPLSTLRPLNVRELRARRKPPATQVPIETEASESSEEEPLSTLRTSNVRELRARRKPPATQVQISEPRISTKTTPDQLDITQLAAWATGHEAIMRFISVVHQWRRARLSTKHAIMSVVSNTDKSERAVGLANLARDFEEKSLLYQVLSALASAKLVADLDSHNQRLGRIRLDPSVTGEILKNRGEPVNRTSRKRVNNMLAKARKLVLLQGGCDGLLCFIPHDKLNQFKLGEEDIRIFHEALNPEVAAALCKAGKMFQDCLWTGDTFPIHRFETRSKSDLEALLLEALLSLLQKPHEMKDNIYSVPDWPRPDFWPQSWPWPTNPDCVLDDPYCGDCSGQVCDCIASCFPPYPDVQICGGKGFGLVARQKYNKDERIGQLVGRIGPPGQYADGWAFDFRRNDIECEPDVGQIYCRDEGNCLRFINHSCGQTANAAVRVQRISGKARTVIFALREIEMREEITVNWGDKYMEGVTCLCVQCSK